MRRTATLLATITLATGLTAGAAYAGLKLPFERTQTNVGGRELVDPTPSPVPTPKPAPTPAGPATPSASPEVEPPTTVAPKPTPPPGGPVLIRPGDKGPQVRELQARLRQIAWFSGDVTDFYGDVTEKAVSGFQAKRGFPATGVVDRRTLARLEEMSHEPTADELANVKPDPAEGAPLDPRCLTGRVLCVDKSSRSLRWVVDGSVRLSLDARFGGVGHETREGQFAVSRKSRDHVSSLYDTSMPMAMFFSGGQAVHYSPDFAAHGYAGASHGCVNIRDYDAIAGLFDEVRVGDRVVVYWS